MNPITPEIWTQGLSYPQYRDRIEANEEVFDDVYANPAYDERDVAFLRGLPPLKILAIAEDWCTDVYHTLPTWARVVEEVPEWSLRIFPRDVEPDLMAYFLGRNKARRIPVYAFYDQRDYLQIWWSGRSEPAQQAVDRVLRGRSFDDLGKEGKTRARTVLGEGYRKRFRRANFEEILSMLEAFFHESRKR